MKVQLLIDGCAVWTHNDSHLVREPSDQTEVTDPEQAAKNFSAIQSLQQEAFAVVAYDTANKPKGPAKIVTLGLLDQNMVHPREVFADAVRDRAASIIVAHNHPSGSLKASPEDISITERLIKAGNILGIPVLDHLILIPDGKFISMKQQGLI